MKARKMTMAIKGSTVLTMPVIKTTNIIKEKNKNHFGSE
tara:strand:+ start:564 stop:680 length:117 start_codon:yes stop_codon:yes gene_type:complete